MTHIYTGDGKGKTTAAAGLAARAAGRGLRVFFAQFMKDGTSGEASALKALNVDYESFPCGFIFGREPFDYEIRKMERAFEAARLRVLSGGYDICVLDEVIVCVSLGLIAESEVLGLMGSAPSELVLTGRGAGAALAAKADLVTDMACVKHYFNKGTAAREGIEF